MAKVTILVIAFLAACGGNAEVVSDQKTVSCLALTDPPVPWREICSGRTVVACEAPTTDPGECYAPGEVSGFWCCPPRCDVISDISPVGVCPTNLFFVTKCSVPIANPGGVDCVPPIGVDPASVIEIDTWCCK